MTDIQLVRPDAPKLSVRNSENATTLELNAPNGL